MAAPLVAVGSHLGLSLVDPMVRFFLAVVAPKILGVRLALAVVVVDSVDLVYPLADLGLVVGVLLVVLVVLAVVVDSMDLLDSLVADCLKTCPPVATHQAASEVGKLLIFGIVFGKRTI